MTSTGTKMHVRTGPAEAPYSSSEAFTPLADIYETQDGTTILAVELPGVNPESVEIKVDKGVLTIKADAALPDVGEGYAETYVGFTSGQFFRAFALSDEVDRDKIDASLADGLLTLTLPKAAAARTRKIEIRS